jgi:thiol-disulfide isomerase/thioredoxin
MRSILRVAVLGLAGMVLSVTAKAVDLAPGEMAPALKVQEFVKGSPISSFDPNKVYVVEFWATWCGPCRTSIPHITKLAKENKDVTFIGVSVWERPKGAERKDLVQKFVEEMGDKMDYNIALDTEEKDMAMSWMQAANQNGIPAAFIVKGGRIQWIGHPMTMEGPLAEVKAGTFDVKKARAAFDKEIASEKAAAAARKEIAAAVKMIKDGQKDAGLAKLDAIVKGNPELKGQVDQAKLNALVSIDKPAALKIVDDIIKAKSGVQMILSMSTQWAAKPETAGFAADAVKKAIDKVDANDILHNYFAGEAYMALNQAKKALPFYDQVLKLVPNSPYKDNDQVKALFNKKREDAAKAANSN